MGCAVRNRAGKMELLTGNQIGALLAEYRLTKYKELGWIPRRGLAQRVHHQDRSSPRRCRTRSAAATA